MTRFRYVPSGVRVDRTGLLDYDPRSAYLNPHRMPFVTGQPMSVLSKTSDFGRGIYLVTLLCLLAGCVSPQMVRCPIADADLTKRILEIAPIGTSRDETIQKLRAAGIDGAFGADKSAIGKDYFCCRSWQRPNGEVWRINLLLHFDKSGYFVETLDLPDLDSSKLKPAKSAS
jgi:hypothetical protein